MTFRLYESESGGTELWTETKDVSVQGGVFSTVLGDKTSLDQAVFDGRELWLGIKVGADAEATPRQMVLPVAYALSLVPGAEIAAAGDDAALELSNTGSGDALHVKGPTTLDGEVSVTAQNYDVATLVVTNTVGDGLWGVGGGGSWDAGVGGWTDSDSHGMGVQGVAAATSGESYGVWGAASSPQGAGVYGRGQGGSHGVSGETSAEGSWAAGVFGWSNYTDTFGVWGGSQYGIGVNGHITEPENTSAAVEGYNTGGGPGVAGYSQNSQGVAGNSDSSHGVYGETRYDAGFYDAAGVMGYSIYTFTAGVHGESLYGHGVFGESNSDDKSGVVGYNPGQGVGVRGHSEDGHGVSGETDNDTGGYEIAGVYGSSTHTETYGVLGESEYGVAVEGRIVDAANTQIAVSGWNSGGGTGVRGYSANSVGVYGDGATYGGLFFSDSGTALGADGDAEVDGDLDVTGRVTGGDDTSLPIAYGFINADGSLESGSPNLSSSWNSQQDWYEISISGYSYDFREYCTIVTPAFGCSPAPCGAQTSSVGGMLLVQIYDGNGSSTQASFQFVTYKP
jgi:hypothetical protein